MPAKDKLATRFKGIREGVKGFFWWHHCLVMVTPSAATLVKKRHLIHDLL